MDTIYGVQDCFVFTLYILQCRALCSMYLLYRIPYVRVIAYRVATNAQAVQRSSRKAGRVKWSIELADKSDGEMGERERRESDGGASGGKRCERAERERERDEGEDAAVLDVE